MQACQHVGKQASKQGRKEGRKQAVERARMQARKETSKEPSKLGRACLGHLTIGSSESASPAGLWAHPGQQTPHRQGRVLW